MKFYCNSKLHNREFILNYFNISNNDLKLLLKYYNLKIATTYSKPTIDVINKYNEEYVKNYYVTQNHELKECLKHFNITQDMFLNILKHYGISKLDTFKNTLNKIKKEDLYNYYIIEKHSRLETLTHFNIKMICFINY